MAAPSCKRLSTHPTPGLGSGVAHRPASRLLHLRPSASSKPHRPLAAARSDPVQPPTSAAASASNSTAPQGTPHTHGANPPTLTPTDSQQPDPATLSASTAQSIQSAAAQLEDEYETIFETETGSETEVLESQPATVASNKQAGAASSAPTTQATKTTTTQSQQPQQPQQPSRQQRQQLAPVMSVGSVESTRGSPLMAAMTTSTQLSPAMQSSVGGWVVAFALLCAARLSREESDAERQDLRALQVRQAESRVQSEDLRAKRRAYLEQERERKEAEAARRLEEARKRSQEEAVARAAREAAYRETAAKETARVWAEQQAAREEFLAQEARLSEELARRTAVEVALREAEAARRKEQEERARAAYEREQARIAAEAARVAEVARQQAEREAAAKQDQRKKLRAAQTRFCLSLEGSATVQQAPPGTLATQSTQPGWQRGPQLARLTLAVSLRPSETAYCFLPAQPSDSGTASDDGGSDGSSSGKGTGRKGSLSSQFGSQFGLGGGGNDFYEAVGRRLTWSVGGTAAEEKRAAFESAAAAVEGSSELTAGVTEALLVPLRQRLARTSPEPAPGSAPSIPQDVMGDLELTHWRRVTAALCDVAVRRAAAQVAPLADRQPLEQTFQVRSLHAVLPMGHEARLDARIRQAVAAQMGGQLEETVALVNQVLEGEEDVQDSIDQLPDAWPPVPPGANQRCELPPLALQCLIYALLMDHVALLGNHVTVSPAVSPAADQAVPAELAAGQQGSGEAQGSGSSSVEPPSSQAVQQTLQLASYQLRLAAKRQEPDALVPTVACIRVALGSSHPLVGVMQELEEANMSTAAKLRAEARKQQGELEIAAARLRAENPMADLNPNDPSSRKALVPVPERLWAVRNTANNLVRFGDPAQANDAIASLERACDLCASHYGPTHPSCMAVLMDTRDALLVALSRCGDDEAQADKLQESLQGVTRSLIDIVQALAERFLAAEDTLSVVILNEAAAKELGSTGAASTSVTELQRQASQLLFQLTPAEARVAMAKRQGKGGLLRTLAREFTEVLGMPGSARRATRLDQWRQGTPLTPLR